MSEKKQTLHRNKVIANYHFENNLDKVIGFLQETAKEYPNGHLELVVDRGYDEDSVEVILHWTEEESDAAFEIRIAADKRRKERDAANKAKSKFNREQNERATYERLKKKFEAQS